MCDSTMGRSRPRQGQRFMVEHSRTDDSFFAEFEALIAASAVEDSKTDDEPNPDRLPARYRIQRLLGAGGMGRVYEAYDTRLRRRVAIKTTVAPSPVHADLMRRECEVLAALHHPGIVAIYDSGNWSSGRAYYVMEFVEGQSLTDFADSQHLSLQQRVALLAQAAEAVGVAHLLGIVHRDLKPENILVDARGRAHVLDFGLAKFGLEVEAPDVAVGGQTQFHTIARGNVRGTLAYMGPEQAAGEHVDARADVYSLGVTLFKLLTGKAPRVATGESPGNWASRLRNDAWPPSRRLSPELPVEVAAIIDRCLSVNLEERYATAKELADDLNASLNGNPVRAVTRWRWAHVARRFAARHRREVAAMTVGLVGILAIGAGAFIQINAERSNALRSAAQARHSEQQAQVARQHAEAREREVRKLLYAADVSQAGDRLASLSYDAAAQRLARQTPIAGDSNLRDIEWQLLANEMSERYFSVTGFGARPTAIALSPTGHFLLADDLGQVVEVDPTSRTYENRIKLVQPISAIAFSPDGSKVAFALRHTVSVFDWPELTGRRQMAGTQLDAKVTALAFDSGSERLAIGSNGGQVVLYEVPSGKLLKILRARRGEPVNGIAFSPNGEEFATIGETFHARYWNARDYSPLKPGASIIGPLSSIAYSPDGKRSAVGNRLGQILIESRDNPGSTRSLVVDGPVTSLRFTSDHGALWAGSEGGNLTLISDGGISRAYRLSDSVRQVCFNDSGTLAVAIGDGNLAKICKLTPAQFGSVLQSPRYTRLFARPSGTLVAGISEQRVAMWDAKASPPTNEAAIAHRELVTGLCFDSSSDRFFTSDAAGIVRCWSISEALLPRRYKTSLPSITALALSPDGRFFCVGSAPGETALYETRSGKELWRAKKNGPVAASIAFSPSGEHCAIVTWDGKLAVRNAKNGELRFETSAHSGAAIVAEYSPDGQFIATGGGDRAARIWRADTGKLETTFLHAGAFRGLCFSPLGRSLATTEYRHEAQLCFWDLSTQQQLFALPLGAGEPTPPCLTADGSLLLIGISGERSRVARFDLRATPGAP